MRFVKGLANYIKCWHMFLTLNHICLNITHTWLHNPEVGSHGSNFDRHNKPTALPSYSLNWKETLPPFPGTNQKHCQHFLHKHALKSWTSKKANLSWQFIKQFTRIDYTPTFHINFNHCIAKIYIKSKTHFGLKLNTMDHLSIYYITLKQWFRDCLV